MQDMTTQSPDRATLRRELEQARDDYHTLLAQVPDDALERPTSNPAWNLRQLLYHMTTALHFLPADVQLIRRGRNPKVPRRLFDVVNKGYNIWAARGHERASLAAEYDKQHII